MCTPWCSFPLVFRPYILGKFLRLPERNQEVHIRSCYQPESAGHSLGSAAAAMGENRQRVL